MKVKVSDSLYGNVPDDVYLLKCVDYKSQSGKHGEFINWSFEVADQNSPDAGVRISGITPDFLAPDSKLFKWLRGFGFTEADLSPVEGQDKAVELDNCVGCIVKGVVENKRDDDNPKKEYSNVVRLIAKKVQQPQQPVPQTVVPQLASQKVQPQTQQTVVQQPATQTVAQSVTQQQPVQTKEDVADAVEDDWDSYE